MREVSGWEGGEWVGGREVSGWEGGRREAREDRSQLKVRCIAPKKRNIKEHEQKQIQGDGKYGVLAHQTEVTSWGGTSKVTVRRSTTLTSSTQGSTKNRPAKTRYSHVVKMANAHVVTPGTCLATQYCTITWSFGPPGRQPTEP